MELTQVSENQSQNFSRSNHHLSEADSQYVFLSPPLKTTNQNAQNFHECALLDDNFELAQNNQFSGPRLSSAADGVIGGIEFSAREPLLGPIQEKSFFGSPKTQFSTGSLKQSEKLAIEEIATFDNLEYDNFFSLDSDTGFAGIINETGYWCFYISAIQALVRTDAITKLLRLMDEIPGLRRGDFIEAFNSIADKLKTTTKAVQMRRLVQTGPEIFRHTHSQQDASECLVLVLEEIEESIKTSEHASLLLDVLQAEIGIETKSTLNCAACKRVHSTAKEDKHLLEIHFERDPELEWKEEVAYECPECPSTTAIQSFQLSRLPDLIILHMKRYQFSSGSTKKLTGESHMPLHFCEHRLVGFICHIGWYQHTGHYVFYFHDTTSGQWLRFDDERVTAVEYGSNELFWLGFCTNETPLLAFYRRVSFK